MLSWLETKSAEFRQICAARLASFNVEQALPYSGKVYTNNFDMLFIGVEMLLKGINIWRTMCDRAKIWPSPEAIIIGTCVLWIGGHYILNGGFGCLVLSKHQRVIDACTAALNGSLSRYNYKFNNRFLAFAKMSSTSPSARSRASPAPSCGPALAQTLSR